MCVCNLETAEKENYYTHIHVYTRSYFNLSTTRHPQRNFPSCRSSAFFCHRYVETAKISVFFFVAVYTTRELR